MAEKGRTSGASSAWPRVSLLCVLAMGLIGCSMIGLGPPAAGEVKNDSDDPILIVAQGDRPLFHLSNVAYQYVVGHDAGIFAHADHGPIDVQLQIFRPSTCELLFARDLTIGSATVTWSAAGAVIDVHSGVDRGSPSSMIAIPHHPCAL